MAAVSKTGRCMTSHETVYCGVSEGLRGERPDTTKVEAPRLLPREAHTAHARGGSFTEHD